MIIHHFTSYSTYSFHQPWFFRYVIVNFCLCIDNKLILTFFSPSQSRVSQFLFVFSKTLILTHLRSLDPFDKALYAKNESLVITKSSSLISVQIIQLLIFGSYISILCILMITIKWNGLMIYLDEIKFKQVYIKITSKGIRNWIKKFTNKSKIQSKWRLSSWKFILILFIKSVYLTQ